MDQNDGYHRLRDGRVSLPGQIYHVTLTTQYRQPVFRDFGHARAVIRVMHRTAERHRCRSLCFALMPDHLHWLVQLGETGTLQTLMRTMKSISAHHVGRPIWQDGYHERAIRVEDDVRAVARYIVANPLRAGLVARVGDYPHWDAVWLL
ncbi:MAG: transposase [Methyloversatilis sp.]|uniref:REP-associated tyrosine transposase n=1 Tax=Methyloversatilis sp. TaxID=2569862 RepID=UPI0025EA9C0A|nr:transposase [Methyloversatilis sp.]MCR6666625.1 transposase [Methyloversatilis sp.]